MPATATRRLTTTQRGLGHAHRQQVAALLRLHEDGTACWWCGRPMFRDPQRNPDGRTLQGDHSKARSMGGTIADRLLHASCNESRGDGSRDAQRPAVTGQPVENRRSDEDRARWCLMGW
ncbi:hypothetical protein B7C42_01635 [Nocardia cerradoensis]|uniref:HNH endonuclease n=1 Tax=Nocardia cerradoensis TaxID=85688 RepID=A0A231HCN8_9NOCA|nr:hypothetical protein [Nocardia cerradoensis]OXR46660.1 hypothetical protein B7C42_01635 [Nocardia cerradoensis]